MLTLTSAGASATVLQWQNAFSAVAFSTSAGAAPGSRTISFVVNDGSKSSVAATDTVAVGKANQTITFSAQVPASHTFASGGTFALNPVASASSGLVVSYSSKTPAICSVSSTTVTMISAGTCTIAADQAGNGNYNAALQAIQSVTIAKDTSAITLTATPNPSTTGQIVTVTATVLGDPPTGTVSFLDGGAPLACSPVSLAPVNSTSSTASCAVAFSTPGNHALTATYSGDANNTAAASVSALVEAVAAPPAPVPAPAPLLDRMTLLLLAGLLGLIAVARLHARA
jgi:hypothetical protein